VARDVNTYLEELRVELAGADPAVAQDALYDAEEYLRAELGVLQEQTGDQALDQDAAMTAVVERYGTPGEVAAAYLAAEAGPVATLEGTTAIRPAAVAAGAATAVRPSPRPERRPPGFFGVMADPKTWTSLVYLLLSLVTGIVYFTLVVTGVSLSAGLFVLIIGVPFALLFLALVRAVSLAEGRIVEVLLGVRMPRRPRLGPSEGGLWKRVRYWLKDRRSWTAMLYMLLQMPLGIVYFTVSVTGLATGLGMIGLPFLQLVGGRTFVEINGSEYLFSWWQMPLLVIGGALLILVTLNLVRLAGRVHASYAKAMLVRAGQQTPEAAEAPAPTGATIA
jgi:hypothetical protein